MTEVTIGADDLCDHDSASGTGEPNTWRCDSCEQVWREVPDPQGTWTTYRHDGTITRFRREALTPTEEQ